MKKRDLYLCAAALVVFALVNYLWFGVIPEWVIFVSAFTMVVSFVVFLGKRTATESAWYLRLLGGFLMGEAALVGILSITIPIIGATVFDMTMMDHEHGRRTGLGDVLPWGVGTMAVLFVLATYCLATTQKHLSPKSVAFCESKLGDPTTGRVVREMLADLQLEGMYVPSLKQQRLAAIYRDGM